MDSTSLTKPVDLQGLSLALAKTKADYDYKINQISGQSDWEETDEGINSYILNKPAIMAGIGENSVVVGSFEQSLEIYKTISITGDASAKTYSYSNISGATTNPSQPRLAYCETLDKYVLAIAWSNNPNTVTFSTTLSSSALNQVSVTIFERSKVTTAIDSFAEGYNTIAAGSYSHVEGRMSIADGVASHAEGWATYAHGANSHSENYNTTANGNYSHSEGQYTIASGNAQHVQGKYNIEDTTSTYAHIVGNGTASARSNAHTLDWSGNSWYAGKVSAGTVASPANPTAANDLTTKAYVDSAISGIVDTNTTYSLSISNNRITLTPSSGTVSYIDLPVYNGGVT